MIVRPAVPTDSTPVLHVYERVVHAMRTSPYNAHWDMEFHPTAGDLSAAIEAGDLFIAVDDSEDASGAILGAFVLDTSQDPQYDLVPWLIAEPADRIACIHLLTGYQIPLWDQVMSLCLKAATRIPQMGYVGWDVAITEDGPLFIEANNLPGHDAFPQMPSQAPDHIGFKPEFQKYLKGL